MKGKLSRTHAQDYEDAIGRKVDLELSPLDACLLMLADACWSGLADLPVVLC
jgi:hypothetical protein